MTELSRRRFLRTGVGATAGIAAVSAIPGGTHIAGALAARPVDLSGNQAEPIVAVVHDASKGQVAVIKGHTETVYTDAELVARLVKATRQG